MLDLAVDPDGEGGDLMVAGTSGEWTFVFDPTMETTVPDEQGPKNSEQVICKLAAATGGPVALFRTTLNGGEGCDLSEDGQSFTTVGREESTRFGYDATLERNVAEPLTGVPDLVLAAVEAAGCADSDEDSEWSLRVVCALAGLTWTVAEFRGQPLVVGRIELTD